MLKEPDQEKYDETELELERERAKQELEENMRVEAKREYQRMVAGLREQVMNFMAENQEMTLPEVAEQFGIREHTIRAWKAHRTMGTYSRREEPEKPAGPGTKSRSSP